MNIFEKLLVILDANMIEPKIYGWFHILFLSLLIFSIVLVKIKYSKLDNKNVKKVLLICSIICLILEIYKQLNFSFNYEGVNTFWSYQWYAFPFQFCSMPMYVALIASLTKNPNVEKATYTFLATFGLVAGISVMLYPATVFIDTIGINIQTMVHHSLMVFMGMFLLLNNKVEYNFKSFLFGTITFIICVALALLIDISTYYLGIDNGLCMFFISPFHKSSLPIFDIIYEKVNYLIFLLTYIISFSIASLLILKISKFVSRSFSK